jgi:large subunit ribosomal protein L10
VIRLKKEDKERVVEDLAERLRTADTVIVADYRGLTMSELDALRGRLLEQGARFSVVKNTLTRRAAEAAGAEALLALLEGPTAIAFLESSGDPVAVAKTIADAARDTRILAIRGGVLEGKVMSADEVESLAKLPPLEILRGQVLGAIIAPLTAIMGLVTAPLQNLVGLIDARIEQLGGADAAAPEGDAEDAPAQPEESEEQAETTDAPAAEAAVAETQTEEPETAAQPAETEE